MATLRAVECAYCHEDIRDDATVCKHCGAYEGTEGGEPAWYPARHRRPMSRRAWWLASAAFVAVVLLGTWWFLSDQQDDAERRADDRVACLLADDC